MKKLEAVKIANILMDNFKMPVARNGMFDSYVVTGKEGRDLLYIAAGTRGVYIDVETLEVVKKASRKTSVVEEYSPRKPNMRLVETFPDDPTVKTYNPEDFED